MVEVLIYQLFENLLAASRGLTCVGFALINVFAMLFAFCLLPELRGRSLEDGALDDASSPQAITTDTEDTTEARGPPQRTPASTIIGGCLRMVGVDITSRARYSTLDGGGGA